MFKTRTSNIKNNVITTIYEHDDNNETQIVDLVFTNIRKDYSIFIDVWLEDRYGERSYINYNKLISNYDSSSRKYNETYKHPIKLIALEQGQIVRVKSYVDVKNRTSSTPSDWASYSIKEWQQGFPWGNDTSADLKWHEGDTTNWVVTMDKYINYTLDSPLTNPFNCSVLMTLNIEKD